MKIKLQLGAEPEDGNLIRGQKAGEEMGKALDKMVNRKGYILGRAIKNLFIAWKGS